MYNTNFDWFKKFGSFSNSEQKVLLALSSEKHIWRSKEGLLRVTGLGEQELDETIAMLLKKDLVKPSFSKSKNLIFKLGERG